MIEAGKMYNDYSKEELDVLPQLPLNVLEQYKGKKVPYMWDGETWQWVMID